MSQDPRQPLFMSGVMRMLECLILVDSGQAAFGIALDMAAVPKTTLFRDCSLRAPRRQRASDICITEAPGIPSYSL